LKLLQHLRNEAHRFAITFHRQQRSKRTISSSLLQLEGIGQSSVTKLLRKFKSVKKIREATLDELSVVVGQARARTILKHFSEQ
jgi:excinuclease ABC subunit C